MRVAGFSTTLCTALSGTVLVVEPRFSWLARDRRLGVGLALVAELCLVSALTLAPAPVEAGVPGVIAAAIAGTVAVVFGVLDGIVLAVIGAVVFGLIDGWSAGALAALVVWPAVVGAVGLFARRVEQQRDLLGQLVKVQEGERRRAALALYDEKSQVLSGALMMLHAAGHGDSEGAAAAAEQARGLISRTISELRTIAADLSPRALEQHSLKTALEQISHTLTENTQASVTVTDDATGQISAESELALYRLAQDVMPCLIGNAAQHVRIALSSNRRELLMSLSAATSFDRAQVLRKSKAHNERLRLLGGHLHISRTAPTPLIIAAVPLLP